MTVAETFFVGLFLIALTAWVIQIEERLRLLALRLDATIAELQRRK